MIAAASVLRFKKTEKQKLATRLMGAFKEVLLEGGSRSGKTFIILRSIVARAIKYPNSRHLILRKHLTDVKSKIWKESLPEVFVKAFPGVTYKERKTDEGWYLQLPNESEIWMGGTSDKGQVEKHLGGQWATIFLNEISEMTYHVYETLKTRLNAGSVRTLFLMDQNPAKKTHWSYLKFHKEVDPLTLQPLSQKVLSRQAPPLLMNPTDNVENLGPDYIETLESLSEAKRRRFLHGQYVSDTEGALWKSQWIDRNRVTRDMLPKDIERIIVSIDPCVTDDDKVTNMTDDSGIVTVGRYRVDGVAHYVIYRDDTTQGLSWNKVACQVFHDEKADRIIAEKNNGGDLVSRHILAYDPSVPVGTVWAARGKVPRAEPIADLTERGKVKFLGIFPELENELTSWVQGDRSPNRLDAMVWGVTELMESTTGSTGKIGGY